MKKIALKGAHKERGFGPFLISGDHMKYFILLFLLSVSALACPNLEGNFKKCQSSVNGAGLFHKIKKVTQEKVDGEVIYAVTFADTPVTERTEFFIADGRPHIVESKQVLGSKNVRTSTVNCEDNKLEIKTVRELVTPFGRKVTSEDTSLLSIKGSVITNNLTYKAPGNSGEAIIICE